MHAEHIRIKRSFPAANPPRINTSEKRRFNFTRINTSKNCPDNLDIFSISFIPRVFNFTRINTSGAKDLKSPRINTSGNKDLKSPRINTSGHKDLKSFRINTSKKQGRGVGLVTPPGKIDLANETNRNLAGSPCCIERLPNATIYCGGKSSDATTPARHNANDARIRTWRL